MMGPYMAPMALNVPVAMLMSLVVSFTITPWLSLHLLQGAYNKPQEKPYVLEETLLYRFYRAVAKPVLNQEKPAMGNFGLDHGPSGLLPVAGCHLSRPP